MNTISILKLKKKENKSEVEWELLKYHSCMSLISEMLVSESKFEISSEDAIREIRAYMNDNL